MVVFYFKSILNGLYFYLKFPKTHQKNHAKKIGCLCASPQNHG
jgi:hypothetical protein